LDVVGVDEKLISTVFKELYFYSDYDKNYNFTRSTENPNEIDIISGLFLNKNINVINRKNKENQTNYNDIIFPQNLNKGKKIR